MDISDEHDVRFDIGKRHFDLLTHFRTTLPETQLNKLLELESTLNGLRLKTVLLTLDDLVEDTQRMIDEAFLDLPLRHANLLAVIMDVTLELHLHIRAYLDGQPLAHTALILGTEHFNDGADSFVASFTKFGLEKMSYWHMFQAGILLDLFTSVDMAHDDLYDFIESNLTHASTINRPDDPEHDEPIICASPVNRHTRYPARSPLSRWQSVSNGNVSAINAQGYFRNATAGTYPAVPACELVRYRISITDLVNGFITGEGGSSSISGHVLADPDVIVFTRTCIREEGVFEFRCVGCVTASGIMGEWSLQTHPCGSVRCRGAFGIWLPSDTSADFDRYFEKLCRTGSPLG